MALLGYKAQLLNAADDAHLAVALDGGLARATSHDVERAADLSLLDHDGAGVVVLDAQPRDDVLHHLCYECNGLTGGFEREDWTERCWRMGRVTGRREWKSVGGRAHGWDGWRQPPTVT